IICTVSKICTFCGALLALLSFPTRRSSDLDGTGSQKVENVEITDFGPIPERAGFIFRLKTMWRVVRDGSFEKGEVVHFHDGIFLDRKSTRLNSSHVKTSYAVFCLKKKIISR